MGCGGPQLSAEVCSLPAEETRLVTTQLWFAQVSSWADGAWSLSGPPCHGSKPNLMLSESGLRQELVFFFSILSTNQSTAKSVSNF